MAMQNIAIIFLILTLTACTSFKNSNRTPSSNHINEYKPLHLVVTVHGLQGSQNTFGALPEIILDQYPKIDPKYDWQVLKAHYPTGNNTDRLMDTYRFATILGEQIIKKLKEYHLTKYNRTWEVSDGLRPEDKISFVTHSQGGLVTSIWYFQSLIKNKNISSQNFHRYHSIAKHVDALITLGTPFWGSKISVFLEEYPLVKWTAKKLNFGSNETQDMAFLSNTIYEFRKLAIELDQQKPDALKQLSVKVRPFNIGGVVPKLSNPQYLELKKDHKLSYQIEHFKNSGFRLFGFGKNRYEGDEAVLIPNSRMDFIYNLSHDSNYSENSVTTIDKFKQTEYFDNGLLSFIALDTIHASTQSKVFYDEAEVPDSCKDQKLQKELDCRHPSYRFIVNHITNCNRIQSTCNFKEHERLVQALFKPKSFSNYLDNETNENLHGFTIDILVKVPTDYIFDENQLESSQVDNVIEFEVNNKNYKVPKEQSYKIEVMRLQELGSQVANNYDNKGLNKGDAYARYSLTGVVYPKNTDSNIKNNYSKQKEFGFPVNFKIKLKGLKTRSFEAKIKPGFSTFIETTMSY